MYYSNYYPYYTYPNWNTQKAEKKDTVQDTIPFNSNIKNNTKNNKIFSFNKDEISFGNFTFQIDDLIIIAIIILLFLETEDNTMLIIVLGLLLLNINLGDILSIF